MKRKKRREEKKTNKKMEFKEPVVSALIAVYLI
jgi:hypothetical protein